MKEWTCQNYVCISYLVWLFVQISCCCAWESLCDMRATDICLVHCKPQSRPPQGCGPTFSDVGSTCVKIIMYLSMYSLYSSFIDFLFISFLDTVTSPDLQCFFTSAVFPLWVVLSKKKSEIQTTFIMWDMRFLWLQLWKLLSSGMWHCVVH